MKKPLLCVVFCFLFTIVVSCENSTAKNSDTRNNSPVNGGTGPQPILPDGSLGPAPPYTGAPPDPFKNFSFVRENFDRERQLWLAQDIQNYAYSLVHFPPNFPYGRILIIQNGEAGYFKSDEPGNYWEIARPPDVFTESLFANELQISITSLYSQIDGFANEKGSRIAIEYNSDFHYPSYVLYVSGKWAFSLSLENFTIDPEIPATVIEWKEDGGYRLIPNPLL